MHAGSAMVHGAGLTYELDDTWVLQRAPGETLVEKTDFNSFSLFTL